MAFPAERAKLAFEQGTKSLAAQVATVDNARTRFGVLLGGGNVATAFLGKDAIARGWPDNGVPTEALGLGFLAFVVFLGACMYGLLPRGGWTFDFSVTEIMKRGEPGSGVSPTIEALHENLALWSESFFDANATLLNRLYLAMAVATLALLVEFGAFVYVLGQ